MPTLTLNNQKVADLIKALELDGYTIGKWDTNDEDGDTVFRTTGSTLKELCESGVANEYASDATVKLVLNMLDQKVERRVKLNKVETKKLMEELGVNEG